MTLGNAKPVSSPSKRIGCRRFVLLCDRGTFPGRKGATIISIRRVWTGCKLISRFWAAGGRAGRVPISCNTGAASLNGNAAPVLHEMGTPSRRGGVLFHAIEDFLKPDKPDRNLTEMEPGNGSAEVSDFLHPVQTRRMPTIRAPLQPGNVPRSQRSTNRRHTTRFDWVKTDFAFSSGPGPTLRLPDTGAELSLQTAAPVRGPSLRLWRDLFHAIEDFLKPGKPDRNLTET